MKGTHKQVMAKKDKILAELREKFGKASIIIFTDYRGHERGLNVKDISELRKRLREHNVEYKIAKNTLISKVLKEKGLEGADEYLKDPTAVVIGYGDPVMAAKTLTTFAKEKKTPAYPDGLPLIKGAHLEGQKLNRAATMNVATLPSRNDLIAQLLSLMNAPAQKVMGILQAPGRDMLSILDQWNKSREGSPAS
ncbi:MAG: 50S ribosomal protein L10 [Candidatus Eremiobacteraeota bacterium]|nr:50S ribosomal protein L10 [Candidatus Eremiobacteraeota bacterium]